MKKLNYFALIGISTLTFMSSCKKDKGKISDLDMVDLGAVIDPPQLLASGDSTIDAIGNNSTIICSEKTYRWAPGEDEPLLLNPATDVIYPGAMIGAGTLATGQYAAITGDRAPITLSVDLANVSNASIEAASGKLSDVRQAITQLLDQKLTGSAGANASYNVEEVYSEAQMRVALGAHGKFGWGSIEGAFDFSTSNNTRKFIAKFTQIYYSVDIDIPESPEKYWKKMPDMSVFNGFVPTVVSSVKYGRVVLFMMEVNESDQDLAASLKASFTSGGFSASFDQSKFDRMVSKKLLVIGGNSGSINVSSPEDLSQVIADGAEYSKDNPGKPLSYKLMFIHDNTVANVVTTSEYVVRNCTVTSGDELVLAAQTITGPYCPVRVGNGDTRIGGNSVHYDISSSLAISQDSTKLLLNITYSINEAGGDESSGYGTWVEEIYQAPSGKKILHIGTDLSSSVNGTIGENQTGTQTAIVSEGNGVPLVSKFRFIGNLPGTEYNEIIPIPTFSCTSANVRLLDIELNEISVLLSN